MGPSKSALLAVVCLLGLVERLSSNEICSCPTFSLFLTAVESETTVKLKDGFLFAAKKDSDVTLKCSLENADSLAITSVTYKFYKAASIGDKPIPLMSSPNNKELCTDTPTTEDCVLSSVQYTSESTSVSSLDNGDNHVYQCAVEITLIDGTPVKLFSQTLNMEVHFPPSTGPPPNTDTRNLDNSKPSEKLQCDLPDSYPKTKPAWTFKKENTVDFLAIDVATDSRVARLIIVEDTVTSTAESQNYERGALVLMMFRDTEDVGEYKCSGVYDSVFDDLDLTWDVAHYSLARTGASDASDALVHSDVSEIVEPLLILDNDPVSLTYYVRDAPGRDPIYGEISYTWQFRGQQDETINFSDHPDLSVSNNGRTLTISDITKYLDKTFQCKTARQVDLPNNDPSTSTITSQGMGIGSSPIIIRPKVMQIPSTYRSGIGVADDYRVEPNKAYMMDTPELAGNINPEQTLWGASQFKYYINHEMLSFLDPTPGTVTGTFGRVTPDFLISRIPDLDDKRCVYWQYERGISAKYQLFEVMLNSQLGDAAVDITDLLTPICDSEQLEWNVVGETVTVTLPGETKIATSQGVMMSLLDSSDAVLDTKSLFESNTATSCADRSMLTTTALSKGSSTDANLKVKIHSDLTNGGSCIKLLRATCNKPDIQPDSNVESISPAESTVVAGESFTFTCNPGWESASYELVCQDDGTLDGDLNCDQQSDDGLSPGAIVGIVIAVLAGLGAASIVLVIYMKNKKCPNKSHDNHDNQTRDSAAKDQQPNAATAKV